MELLVRELPGCCFGGYCCVVSRFVAGFSKSLALMLEAGLGSVLWDCLVRLVL